VLLPALVKREFPERLGLVTGVYTTVVSLGAAAAAGATVPLADLLGGGWRPGLGVWAVPAAVALAVWVPLAVSRHDPALSLRPSPAASLLRDRLAWSVTAFLGLQSLSFYAMLAWLPSVLREEGLSALAAGGLLGLLTTIGTPLGLALPSLLVRARDQRRWVAVVTGTTAAGLLGLAVAPGTVPALWAVLIGLGQGAAFPLALTLVVLRARDGDDAARLSAMAQGFGYCLAATGPLLLGALRDAAGSWHLPIGLLVVLLVPQLVAGLDAGRDAHVGVARA
jgi:MFS transporter, CP family, cyanate transporter